MIWLGAMIAVVVAVAIVCASWRDARTASEYSLVLVDAIADVEQRLRRVERTVAGEPWRAVRATCGGSGLPAEALAPAELRVGVSCLDGGQVVPARPAEPMTTTACPRCGSAYGSPCRLWCTRGGAATRG